MAPKKEREQRLKAKQDAIKVSIEKLKEMLQVFMDGEPNLPDLLRNRFQHISGQALPARGCSEPHSYGS